MRIVGSILAPMLLFVLPLASAMPAAAAGGVITACAYGQTFTAGSISVRDGFARATPKGAQTAAAFVTIANAGSAEDTLAGATSAAGDVMLHQMKQNGSVMEMAAVYGGLVIPAGGSVDLEAAGYHLMITGLSQPLAEGECLEMTLHFAKAGDVTVQLNIGGFGQKEPPSAPGEGTSSTSMGMGGMDMDGMSSMPGM